MFRLSDSKKKYWLIAVFLFCFGVIGIVTFFWPTENLDENPQIENQYQASPADIQPPAQHYSASFPHFEFRFTKSTRRAYLSVNAVARKDVLNHIAKELNFEIITNADGDRYLQETVNFEIEDNVDLVIRKLLGSNAYNIFSVQSDNKKNEEKVFYCVGENACPDPKLIVKLSETEDENLEPHIVPSQQFQQMIAESVTPGTKVDLAERNRVLKDEFRYASADTKIQILQELSVSMDLDFILDALKYEEQTSVRQAAAQALFYSEDERATSAMLDALDDSDETLVLTVINVLSRSENSDLKGRVSRILANHPSKSIQLALQELGYPL